VLASAVVFMSLTTGVAARPQDQARTVVIGIDGMDYHLTSCLMREGRLPNLASLAERGSLLRVESSMPPLSPVAWSNFITGSDPGGHGVFDFLTRDPARVGRGLSPEDAITKRERQDRQREWRLPFTGYVWPSESSPRLRRRGVPFWDVLATNGVETTMYKVPANYPASESAARVIAGMGTPDILGTYGTFTYVSTRHEDLAGRRAGGRFIYAAVREGRVVAAAAEDPNAPASTPSRRSDTSITIEGPLNPFRSNAEPASSRRTEVPLEIHVDPEQCTAVIEVQSTPVVLKQGEWSEWVTVKFPLLPPVKSVRGNVRFYLQEASPSFRLFITPLNLLPGADGLASRGLDVDLGEALGPYFTKGMSEETKPLTQGLFTPEEYLRQSDLVLGEAVEALHLLLGRQRSGFLFFYFSTLDLNCHVMWKHQDPRHPAREPASARQRSAISDLYARMDQIVGTVLQSLRPDDRLYVLSDHGFAPMYREFNLQAWLAAEGYLAHAPGGPNETDRLLADVNWANTRAYGLGFQSLFINLKGREAHGVVQPEDYERTVDELRSKLLALRDEGRSVWRNSPVFRRVYRAKEIYSGPCVASAPDLILGYSRGYGPSDATVLGTCNRPVLRDHVTGFSGHHTTDSVLVPGVLFSNRKLPASVASLQDLTVTILKDFGMDSLPDMTGRPLY
jgi:predicted AlkP superfamily phosphohydrolase/phosphomutase